MLASGTILAQLRPPTTDVIVQAFTASTETEVSLIVICNNRNNSQGFSIYHDDDGTTFDLDTALYIESPVAANSTVRVESASVGAGILVSKGGTLAVASSFGGGITFTIYGTTARVTGYG